MADERNHVYNTTDAVLKMSNTKPEIYSDFRQKPDAEFGCAFLKGSLASLRMLPSYPIPPIYGKRRRSIARLIFNLYAGSG